ARVPQGNLGIQSSLKASSKLLSLMEGVDLQVVFEPREIIILRNDKKESVAYNDTPLTRRMRRNLERYNSSLAQTEISILGRTVHDGDSLIGLIDLALLAELNIDGDLNLGLLARNMARRIFNNSNFKHGGRFYGWWQGLPESVRRL